MNNDNNRIEGLIDLTNGIYPDIVKILNQKLVDNGAQLTKRDEMLVLLNIMGKIALSILDNYKKDCSPSVTELKNLLDKYVVYLYAGFTIHEGGA